MGFNYDLKSEYSRKCAENLFPKILAQAQICMSAMWANATTPVEAHGRVLFANEPGRFNKRLCMCRGARAFAHPLSTSMNVYVWRSIPKNCLNMLGSKRVLVRRLSAASAESDWAK